MDISVKPLLSAEKSEVTFSFQIPVNYKENGYKVISPADIKGEITDRGGYMLLSADCSLKYETECARCLKKLEGECNIKFTRPVAVKLEGTNEEEEYLLVGENSTVNIDEAVYEELLLSLPLRSLCKDDCKGLCPKCGCNRNEAECTCETREKDPRWDVLKKLL